MAQPLQSGNILHCEVPFADMLPKIILQLIVSTQCLLNLITVCSLESAVGFELIILHTNDVHARFEQFNNFGLNCSNDEARNGKCYGGIARRFTKIREIRTSHKNVLLVDAGDQFSGTSWFNVYSGNATAYFMNVLGYDAMCLGSHEFDLGMKPLVDFLNNVTFPVVCANTNMTDMPILNGTLLKSVQIKIGNENVGITGYITQETPHISTEGILIDIFDIITAIRQEVIALQSKGINKIIALGHAGFDIDKQVAGIDGIDLVVGGHTDTFLYNGNHPDEESIKGPYPVVIDQPSGGKGLVVQAYTMGKYLGYLNITFDDNGVVTKYSGNPILLNSNVKEDSGMLSTIQKWMEPVKSVTSEIIGFSKVILEGKEGCILKECNLGNLMTDAIIDYHINLSHTASTWAPAAIALWVSGCIRKSLGKGYISVGDAMAVLPFRETIDIVSVTGKTIREQLEHSVSLNGENTRFLQMSGLHVVYNLSKPAGERVVEVEALCLECKVPSYLPLKDNSNYRIYLSSFIQAGGDGYNFQFSQKKSLGTIDLTIMTEYLKKYSPVFPASEGRIRFTSSSN